MPIIPVIIDIYIYSNDKKLFFNFEKNHVFSWHWSVNATPCCISLMKWKHKKCDFVRTFCLISQLNDGQLTVEKNHWVDCFQLNVSHETFLLARSWDKRMSINKTIVKFQSNLLIWSKRVPVHDHSRPHKATPSESLSLNASEGRLYAAEQRRSLSHVLLLSLIKEITCKTVLSGPTEWK